MAEHNPTILIIDDESSIRETYRMILGPNYSYFYAENADQAEKELNSTIFSLILLDLHMPNRSGLDLLPIIKKHNPDSSVIIVTGSGSYRASLEAIKYQVAGFIEKDFCALDFRTLVEDTLYNRQKKLLLSSLEKDLSLRNIYE